MVSFVDGGPGSRNDRIAVVVAGSVWDGVPMSEQHVARQLAAAVPVLWVDPPISWATAWRNPAVRALIRGPRLRPVAPGVLRLTVVTVPGLSRPGLRAIARRQSERAIRRVVRRANAEVVVTIGASPEAPLRAVPTGCAVLYATDDWPAGAELMGLDAGWIRRGLARGMAEADVVVVVSEQLRDQWSVFREDLHVVPNGCDAQAFAAVEDAPIPDDVRLPAPRAGFVGHLSERIDLSLLEAVADRGVSLLLVGPRQQTFQLDRVEALLARPNVQWVGAKPFDDLPSYLRVIDVGLTPYTDSAFNRASFPLKTLEYLAAGRPVVATDLPATRSLDPSLVRIVSGPAAFADAVVKTLAGERSAGAGQAAARRSFARRHDWAARTEEIAALAGLPPMRVGGGSDVKSEVSGS